MREVREMHTRVRAHAVQRIDAAMFRAPWMIVIRLVLYCVHACMACHASEMRRRQAMRMGMGMGVATQPASAVDANRSRVTLGGALACLHEFALVVVLSRRKRAEFLQSGLDGLP